MTVLLVLIYTGFLVYVAGHLLVARQRDRWADWYLAETDRHNIPQRHARAWMERHATSWHKLDPIVTATADIVGLGASLPNLVLAGELETLLAVKVHDTYMIPRALLERIVKTLTGAP